MKARRPLILFFLLTVVFVTPAEAEDWPCYKKDTRRSSVTGEKLKFPLASTWTYRSAQRPKPAWPEPGRTMHLLDFDYAFQPVVAGGLVYFGSSADDTVRALDESTGEEKWCFTTRAPVRFAPHIADGKCYVAGDDGWVYCLDASTGKLVWEFRAAPDHRMAIGNGRMISRSPCRSGVLVVDGIVYVTAGMWPSEGIYLYGLDAHTGKVIWCNDTTGSMYLRYPHAPSVSFGGPAPQGYLLAANNILLAPTGKAAPAGFDRHTGRLLYYRVTCGGTWATIADGVYFNTAIRFHKDQEVTSLGEHGPSEGDGMGAYSLATGAPGWKPAESYRKLARSATRKPFRGQLRVGLVDRHRVLFHNHLLYAAGNGVVEAVDCSSNEQVKLKWATKHSRVYSIALAGDALLVGGAGGVTALRAEDGKRIWRAEVNGQARGLAIASGRLIVSTDKGTIHCFARGKPTGSPIATGLRPLSEDVQKAPASATAEEIIEQIPNADMLRGYALVIGSADARFAEALASHTKLNVISVLEGESQVSAEQQRLMKEGRLYGSRVVVHGLADKAALPYAKYFANVVVVFGEASGISGKELYRVLRPCGGRMFFAASDRATAEKIVRQGNVPRSEVKSHRDSITVVRGKLPGAFDWNSQFTCDHRVEWPLELLWFGGPGPARMLARHWKAPTPVFANGRYYAIGQYHLIAVDAYNGCELWSRHIGGKSGERSGLWQGYRILKLAADDKSVYVNFPDYCVEFDGQTGKIKKVHGQLKPSPKFALKKPETFTLRSGERSGKITISKTDVGLELTLLTETSETKRENQNDSWELHFDFRGGEDKLLGHGSGLFRLVVTPETGGWHPGLGSEPPALSVTKKELANGSSAVVTIAWDKIRKLVGTLPGDFRFAATLVTYDDDGKTVRIDQFADGLTTFLNNGWATFVIDSPAQAPIAGSTPLMPTGNLNDLPDFATQWPRQPAQFTARWTIDAYDLLELKPWPPLKRGQVPPERVLPLTGKTADRTYTRSYGCCGTISSLTTDFFRSGTFGIYDRADDSGLRNFSAIRPGCGMTMVPAGGVLVCSEGAADCTCAYNFQTSLALAPAEKRKNEDWAMFNAEMSTSMIGHAGLNLGAPGDRRDDAGLLWLGFPRQPVALGRVVSRGRPGSKYTFDLPCVLDFYDGFGTYRFNSDRRLVKGTERPWIYASGCQGLKKATLDVVFCEPKSCVSPGTGSPPRIDGDLSDSCWNGVASLLLPEENAEMYLRHDADNLYIAGHRKGNFDRKGKAVPLEISLKDGDNPKFVRLQLSADGSRHGALLDYALDIPRLDGLSIDGKADDWRGKGYHLDLPNKGSCRLGWNDRGLVLLAELPKDFFAASPEFTGMMAMFIRPESFDFLQLAVEAKSQTYALDHRIREADEKLHAPVLKNVSGLWYSGRPFGKLIKDEPTVAVVGAKTDDGVLVETLFPWDSLKVRPEIGKEMVFQVAFYDPAKTDLRPRGAGDWRFRVLRELDTNGRLRLAEKTGPRPGPTRLTKNRGSYLLSHSLEEDGGWSGKWSGAARIKDHSLHFEMAVPWKSLAAAGIRKNNLKINVRGQGKLNGTAKEVSGKFDRSASVVHYSDPVRRSRPYTVRLHFAEPADVQPGERVFDVKLQGKVVLKNLDVVKAAKGSNTALVKEFKGIMAEKAIDLQLVPKARKLTDRNVPIISGIEVRRE